MEEVPVGAISETIPEIASRKGGWMGLHLI